MVLTLDFCRCASYGAEVFRPQGTSIKVSTGFVMYSCNNGYRIRSAVFSAVQTIVLNRECICDCSPLLEGSCLSRRNCVVPKLLGVRVSLGFQG